MTKQKWTAILRHYDANGRRRSADELNWFSQLPSLNLAIARAALATDSRGKRFGHQCRIRAGSLAEAHNALRRARSSIHRSRSFDELLGIITFALDEVAGIGELFCYDTAFRIGGHLRLYPQKIYLHSGTRQGARALGIRVRHKDALEVTELPTELRCLSPHEVEDVLCIYKDQFSNPETSSWRLTGCASISRGRVRRRECGHHGHH